MSEKARALWFTEPWKVELREEEVEPRRGEVLVRSELIGISHGTEMLFFQGSAPEALEADLTLHSLGGKIGYPIKYGYINVGVNARGARVFAYYPHQDLFAVPGEDLVEVPAGLDAEDAVFLAHMETAVSIVQDAAPLAGETVLVMGQGTIGLLTAEILARMSVARVITVEPSELRRKASLAAGCTALEPWEGEAGSRILDITGGRGVDLAINTSGSPSALQSAIDALAFEGTVVEASWYGRNEVSLDLGAAFHRKRLAIRSSQVSRIGSRLSGRWDKKRRLGFALELLEKIRPSKHITHRFPLRDAQSAYELISRAPGEVIQAVLVP